MMYRARDSRGYFFACRLKKDNTMSTMWLFFGEFGALVAVLGFQIQRTRGLYDADTGTSR